jgi:hypothetical protein
LWYLVGPVKWAYSEVEGYIQYCFIFRHTPHVTIKHA